MKAQLTREWTFDAAHRIISHAGKCSSLHGHTWRVAVTVEGDVQAHTGMVMDFAELKDIGDSLFMDSWDHACILNIDDPLVPPIRALDKRHFICSGEPTSERLCDLAARYIAPLLPEDVRLVRVYIHETPNCSAAVEWSPQ